MIKLIIFDLWQTLAYRQVPYSTTSKMLEVTKVKIPKDKFVKIFEKSIQTKKWQSKIAAYKNLCKNMRLPVTRKNIHCLMEIRDRAEAKTKLYSYTIPLLKQLRSQKYKIGLMSNTSIFTKKYIKRTGLLKYIDYALFSFEIGVIKPDLKFFRIMRQKAKCRFNEMLMIGDKKGDDVIPARKLGIQAIHFKNYPQLKERLKKFSIFIN